MAGEAGLSVAGGIRKAVNTHVHRCSSRPFLARYGVAWNSHLGRNLEGRLDDRSGDCNRAAGDVIGAFGMLKLLADLSSPSILKIITNCPKLATLVWTYYKYI